MANFPKALTFVLSNEDYAPDDPRYGQVHMDNNKAKVRFGLNQAYHTSIPQAFFEDMPIDQAMQVARTFYEDTYWVGICGNLLTDQCVASKLLDMSVNQGIKEAATLFQRVVYDVPAGGFTLDIDSKIGLNTVSHANAMVVKDLIQGLIDHWQWFITQELRNKPQDTLYERDWRSRANKIPSE